MTPLALFLLGCATVGASFVISLVAFVAYSIERTRCFAEQSRHNLKSTEVCGH